MRDIQHWQRVCGIEDVLPDTGVCARVAGRQIALFRVADQLYAIDNRDPFSGANVLSRGIVGDLRGELVVASPLYKQHFSLRSGRCIEAPERSVRAYPVRVLDGAVWVRPRRSLVVIGNGIAGLRAVEELLEVAPQAYDVTVFGAEPHPGYNRVLLSPVLAGDATGEELELHGAEWYAEHGVIVHAADPVVQIDRRRRVVHSAQGRVIGYDRLLIATGSHPVRLAVPGCDLAGVLTFRNLGDLDAMLAAAHAGRRAVVIGGGVLGVEAASGLCRRGMQVTLVHRDPLLMGRQLDGAAAEMLRAALEERGIRCRLACTVEALEGEAESGRRAVRQVRLAGGERLGADLVVMAVGIRPNTDLAQRAGLRCERGILVDDTLQTFDPAIYAVGECVQHRNSTFGLVAPLWEQARVCAIHLAEVGVSRYVERVRPVRLRVSGIQLYSAGEIADGPGREVLVLHDARRGLYRRVVLEQGRMVGVVLHGDAEDASWYLNWIVSREPVGAMRDKLLFGAGAAPAVANAR